MPLFHVILALASAQSAPARLTDSDRVIETRFTCSAEVPASDPGHETLLWIPVPSDSPLQTVKGIKVNGANFWSLRKEDRFGNWMVYAKLPGGAAQTVRVTYEVERSGLSSGGLTDGMGAKEFLSPDSLVPVGGKYAAIADSVVGAKKADVKAIFDHVVATMQYDYKKESPKLGQGDVAFVCDYKKGNCSDLHSYLISLLRTVGLPSYIEYGFPISGVPVGGSVPLNGTIGGYHCWTWFFLDGKWRPLDASDARRWLDSGNNEISQALYGSLVLERSAVAVSRGRDIVLSPPQSGPPLNNFIYPYAEAGGKSLEVKWQMSYERTGPTTRASSL